MILLLLSTTTYSQQQDVAFHLSSELLNGKTILKIKRDFYDPYLWVLAKNNEVYRINSLTKKIDDYSDKFAAYSSLQFIDIAGRSQDTVFIAANSANIVQYKNGSVRLLGPADGILGTVNSIGIDKNLYYQETYVGHCLIIGTSGGFCRYNMDNENAAQLLNNGSSKIYEATYRKEMYKDSFGTNPFAGNDTINYLPVDHENWAGGVYGEYLWEGGKSFGYNINTAYYISSDVQELGDVTDLTNLFWGNNKGMFQNSEKRSYSSGSAHGHYLNDITVNKITSIYGLVALGDNGSPGYPGNIKENLLVGTDVGLYFSSTVYNNYESNTWLATFLRQFSLFHYGELGNIRVNDICVNTSSTTMPICEDGVWLACDNGLYLIKPDYAPFWNGQQSYTISFENQANTVSKIELCAGSSVTAVASFLLDPTIAIQWYANGKELPGKSQNSLEINSSGDYYAVLYDPCGNTHLESNHLTVQVITAPVFTFNYPDKIQQCDNTPLTLQTTDNPGYTYRWYTNGVLNGNTTSSYTVTQTGKYKVEVSACTNSWVPSKEVEVDLVTLPVPQVTSDKAVYCAEDIAVLAESAPTDPSYTINWYRDGTLLTADKNLTTINETTAGSYTVVLASTISTCTQTSSALPLAFTPAPVFTFNYPNQLQYCIGTLLTLQVTGSANYQYRWYKDGTLNGITTTSLPITRNGAYKVEVSSCAGSWVASKEVQVAFVIVPVPAISTDKPAYCVGDNATLSLAETVDPDYTIQWYKDNVPVPNSTGQSSIVTNVPGSYTVTLAYSTPNTDGSTCSQSSAVQAITFNPPPTVSIEKIVNTTICDGQTINLKANYNGGTVQWSTGETTDQVSITQAGTYTATVTSTAGCQAAASTDIAFLPNPVFSVNDTTICTYKKQVVTLTAPAGFAQYDWNGQTGGQTYQVSQPQTVSLTVTDANGCQATQQIKVADRCPDIYIPNTFTPNGDGINDTWVIEGLDSDPTSTVKVFTRNGVQVFSSIGYGTPWNGEYKGKKLPAGAYYYIVTAKNGSQKFSGSLTVIY
ncbi:gliding motility-associated C-terminal domain-containing protein [Mucilaginibacter gotjawali]|uniref:Gliding motility-associated-like protein n=1 Tax=Mucilaginibacter gotjawali TaxID=1550579 RepID=A0A839SJ16_9SPHI|nr:gliding motility-associated C-terminal domain-containing protein [Mucilaginibacter gotjawali]MBB3058265.1 gliding motility-associated-like protein [Mucilaginibacter gotjawali]